MNFVKSLDVSHAAAWFVCSLPWCILCCFVQNKRHETKYLCDMRRFFTDPLHSADVYGEVLQVSFKTIFWNTRERQMKAQHRFDLLRSCSLECWPSPRLMFFMSIYVRRNSPPISLSCWSRPEAKHLISATLRYISCEQRTAEKMLTDPEKSWPNKG